MKKILVVEDETAIREFIIINLKRNGYEVFDADCGEKALKLFEKYEGKFDIVMLDVMMPGMDGFTVCKKIRQKSATIGVIMLTAKSQEMDRVTGLMIGADDYITKPFSTSELIARVDALYRRVAIQNIQGKGDTRNVIHSGKFEIDTIEHTIRKNGMLLDITQLEYQIMEYFIANPGVTLSRKNILESVWGKNYIGDEKIVDVNIRRLRMKIEDEPSSPSFIDTVWGIGYRWEV